ncbi:MAG: FAD-dependent oxidoreductase [Zetaproteobacteria bacterium]|nr:FAD-dependent oxidoreductase [Zetaproteobacteria bacterium]
MIAIIGAGLTGLTAALHLAESGHQVAVFEAGDHLGGRTRSFVDTHTQTTIDHGPHLLCGAYHATRKLLNKLEIESNVTWQAHVTLPLWEHERGGFLFSPSAHLPLALAIFPAVLRMPEHGFRSILGMIATQCRAPTSPITTVHAWLKTMHAHPLLIRDFLEPLCFATMNESMATANAVSFQRLLKTAFHNHDSAKLGWFNRPLTDAIITPLQCRLEALQIPIQRRTSIRKLSLEGKRYILHSQSKRYGHFDQVILAIPAYAKARLLNTDTPDQKKHIQTRSILNLHLWFKELAPLPTQSTTPFIGGLGTQGQWFFDISAQMVGESNPLRHLCMVVSAPEDLANLAMHRHADWLKIAIEEFAAIYAMNPDELQFKCAHHRLIHEKRATVLVQEYQNGVDIPEALAHGIIDRCEQPRIGELPATIEMAIQRGDTNALITS